MVAYYWISFKDNKDFNNLIVKSIASSYLLTTIFDMVASKYNIVFDNQNQKVIAYFGLSAILGLVIGKVISHRWYNALLHKLHVGRTTNENIWDDIIKPYTSIRVFMKDGSSYYGQYRYGEPFKSEPVIVLATYQKLDRDNNVVIDNVNNLNELIVLNTKDFEKIEVVYQKRNNFWTKIKEFWEEINNA